jgi:signal transduction histidine kinase/CheY-like chemotaxis protein
LRFALLCVLYAAVNWLSLTYIPTGPSGASLVWPVAAAGAAGLLFWGLDLWPALLLPMFLVLLGVGYTPPLATGVALGNTIEALVAAYVLLRVGFHPLMSRLRDSLALILAAFVATFFSAFVIAGSATLFYSHVFSSDLWIRLWIGHTVSLLSFGPFVMRWGYRPFFKKTWQESLEGVVLFGAIFVLSFLMSWTPHGSVAGISLIYVLILPLIWASLRTGPRGISLALFIVATTTVSGVLWGYGPITAHAATALFGLQTLIGTISIIFLLFTSITEERKEAVIALEGHVNQLENALEKISSEDHAKAEFIAILAHELRNPLSPVLSGLEILKTRAQNPEDIHTMMGAHLNTLARLLDDLLDITRISQQKFVIEREHTTLQAVLERSLEMALPYLTSRGHTFVKKVPQEDIVVNADPVRLSQVFVNLLNNAAKYTPEGGRIELVAAREGTTAVVRVRDNGQGIHSSRMHQIFEPFAGGAQRVEGPGGLHIGLSLVKRMVELHQGSVEVLSGGTGEGREFVVRLPLLAPSGAPAQARAARAPRGRFSKEAVEAHAREAGPIAVMVVDDNEAAAQMLGTLLTHNGHKVVTAYTGYKALEEAGRSRPQVALLDIGLPDLDGYEVGKRLRAQFGYDIALVALTGYGQDEDRDKARQAGFDEHLVKPVSIVDVERVLAKLKKA